MPLLEVKDLHKSFKGHPSVNGISFGIEAGRCVALLGPNGAGKTTTLRMLAGLLTQSAGSITFGGSSPGTDYRQYLGYLPKPRLLQLDERSRIHLICRQDERHECTGGCGGIGRCAGACGTRLCGTATDWRLFRGMKQRLGLGQALVHRPRLLLLDEPVSALDPIGRREVMELLRDIREETTVIFSTHVLHDAEEICDDVVLMNKGTIAVQGTLSSLRAEYSLPVIRLTTGKEDSAIRWLEALRHKDFIEEALISDGKAVFNVTDVALARRTLLQEAVEPEYFAAAI